MVRASGDAKGQVRNAHGHGTCCKVERPRADVPRAWAYSRYRVMSVPIPRSSPSPITTAQVPDATGLRVSYVPALQAALTVGVHPL